MIPSRWKEEMMPRKLCWPACKLPDKILALNFILISLVQNYRCHRIWELKLDTRFDAFYEGLKKGVALRVFHKFSDIYDSSHNFPAILSIKLILCYPRREVYQHFSQSHKYLNCGIGHRISFIIVGVRNWPVGKFLVKLQSVPFDVKDSVNNRASNK